MVTELWILYTHGGSDRFHVHDFFPNHFAARFEEKRLLKLALTNGSTAVIDPSHVIAYSYRTK